MQLIVELVAGKLDQPEMQAMSYALKKGGRCITGRVDAARQQAQIHVEFQHYGFKMADGRKWPL